MPFLCSNLHRARYGIAAATTIGIALVAGAWCFLECKWCRTGHPSHSIAINWTTGVTLAIARKHCLILLSIGKVVKKPTPLTTRSILEPDSTFVRTFLETESPQYAGRNTASSCPRNHFNFYYVLVHCIWHFTVTLILTHIHIYVAAVVPFIIFILLCNKTRKNIFCESIYWKWCKSY